MRALSTTVLHWRTSPHADETARVKRDVARQKHSHETECLGENSRLVCNTGYGVAAPTYVALPGTFNFQAARKASRSVTVPEAANDNEFHKVKAVVIELRAPQSPCPLPAGAARLLTSHELHDHLLPLQPSQCERIIPPRYAPKKEVVLAIQFITMLPDAVGVLSWRLPPINFPTVARCADIHTCVRCVISQGYVKSRLCSYA
jgi:hypothetical protein